MRPLSILLAGISTLSLSGLNDEAIPPDAYEPDGTPATASPITLGETQSFHSINTGDEFGGNIDVDFVSFSLAESMTVLVDTPIGIGLTGVAARMPIALFDSAENPIGSPASARVLSLAPGNYFASVTSNPPFNTSPLVPLYSILLRDASLPDRYEDDDISADATFIGYGLDGQAHNFDTDGDGDWLRFTSGTGGIAQTTIDVAPLVDSLVPLVRLFAVVDGDLVEITVQEQFGSQYYYPSYFGASEFLIFIANPQGGRPPADTYYFVSVSARFGGTGGDAPGTVAGSVTDGTNGIANAVVRASGSYVVETQTDSDGVYAFATVPPGSPTIRATVPGYVPQEVSTSVMVNEVNIINFALDAANPSDLNSDADVNSQDIQLVINAVLGLIGAADVNNDGFTNSSDIQIVINTVLEV